MRDGLVLSPMRTKRLLARAAVTGSFAVAMSAALGGGGCGPDSSCTPEDLGLGGATMLTLRRLPEPKPTRGACARPRVEVISSPEALQAVYNDIDVSPGDADGGVSSVDFTRERVIVREGVSGQGISWAVARGEQGFVGLLACRRADTSSCIVEVVAVSAPITSVETRTCDFVSCGPPRTTAPRH